MHKSSIIAIAGLVAMLSAAAFADPHITKGPYTFEDNAFADRAEPVDPTVVVNDPDDLVPGQPSILLVPAGVGFQQALTGSDLSKGGGLVYGGAVELIFEDNAFFNGDGPDLVLFESGTPEPFQVAIGLGGDEFTAYEFYDTKSLGFSEGGIGINGAAIDLNDFGLDAGAWFTRVRVKEDPSDEGPVLRGAGALNSGVVPEPISMAFMASAFAGVVGWRLRRRARRRDT